MSGATDRARAARAPRIRYQVAASLDGYIAAPNGEHDWIVMDPDIDFGALFAQFDTFIMGRKTFETAGPGSPVPPGARAKLTLAAHRIYKSGVAMLEYTVERARLPVEMARHPRSTRRAKK